ncbi:MAG: glutamine synthetase III family protein [Planctomycetota bacterium]|jgi:glutamine synthetase
MSKSVSVTDIFGSNVFSEAVMRERLPKNVFKAMMRTIDKGENLDPALADVVANAVKDWAIEKGATHFSHWFQPMTGFTAEKHDSFISPTSDGRTIMEFSGKELIQGEPDASSFPSGGLRATFEARGYTAWDCTSPVFVKEDGDNVTLYIPSAFASYKGQTLDKKTPLLRSMDALNKQAVRVLHALGNTDVASVRSTLGAEQEYFLIDKKFAEKRLDLLLAGRTLFGAPSPKGQEKDDHYFGSLDERVASYMSEVNVELWKLGVSAKTQHNEVSPAQYEIAPVFATVNVATDHNQLTMETLQKVALRHGFICLLHEKPFAGVNGSGKHNNWSACTDTGMNLLEPGSTPHENMVFLVFLCAVIKAVDNHSKLLRATVANAGNDHRLGANEAPPAIISIFLGEQLTDIFDQLSKGAAKSSKKGGVLNLGVTTLPALPKDNTDRNRTSPFAFTGNKFEFRMVGSSTSTSGPTFVLNTIIADELCNIADELGKAKDIKKAVLKVLQGVAKDHKDIIFNGDNYSEEWVKEAEKRGLPNLKNAVDALEVITGRESIKVFSKHKVLSKEELYARQEILFENYCLSIGIEAKAMLSIGKRQILPAAIKYSEKVATAATAIKQAGVSSSVHEEELEKICSYIGNMTASIADLEAAVEKVGEIENAEKQSVGFRDEVIPVMEDLRYAADELEKIVDAELWPLPTYAEMLFLR